MTLPALTQALSVNIWKCTVETSLQKSQIKIVIVTTVQYVFFKSKLLHCTWPRSQSFGKGVSNIYWLPNIYWISFKTWYNDTVAIYWPTCETFDKEVAALQMFLHWIDLHCLCIHWGSEQPEKSNWTEKESCKNIATHCPAFMSMEEKGRVLQCRWWLDGSA